MTSLRSLRILDIMSEAVNVIAEGEVQQLMNCNGLSNSDTFLTDGLHP